MPIMCSALSTERLISSSSAAWKLLRGCAVLYKPAGLTTATLRSRVAEKLAEDLNQMDRAEKAEKLARLWEKSGVDPFAPVSSCLPSKAISRRRRDPLPAETQQPETSIRSLLDYSEHPLVLGDGFKPSDIRLGVVNPMNYRRCGLMVATINDYGLCRRLQGSAIPRTYRIRGEFGRATDNGWTDGVTVEKTLHNARLKPHVVAKALAAIASSHRREALNLSKVSLQSQEAYELAARGPLRPGERTSGQAVIQNMRHVELSREKLEVEVTCLQEDDHFLVDLMTEIGIRLKTSVAVSQVRCIRFGFFTLEHALLLKHVDLEHVLNNVALTRQILRENEHLIAASANFQAPIIKEDSKD